MTVVVVKDGFCACGLSLRMLHQSQQLLGVGHGTSGSRNG